METKISEHIYLSEIDDYMLSQLLLFLILFYYYTNDFSRNNGLLVMTALGFALFMRFFRPKFWKKLIIAGLVIWLDFLTSSGLWLIWNYDEFDSPFFTRNTMLLYNENMFKTIWEVRDKAPSPDDFFKTHTLVESESKQ